MTLVMDEAVPPVVVAPAVHEDNKPIISTMINTTALALTSFGTVIITTNSDGWEPTIKGIILICFGGGLEFCKYMGMKYRLW